MFAVTALFEQLYRTPIEKQGSAVAFAFQVKFDLSLCFDAGIGLWNNVPP